MIAVVLYGGYRLYRRTDALGAPAIITPSMDVHRLLSPSLAVRWDRLIHGNAPPAGPRPKLIALTFDDGPYPVDTPLLLDALGDLHVHGDVLSLSAATPNNIPNWCGVSRRAAARVADHTQTHPDLDRLDDAAVRAEIDQRRRATRANMSAIPRSTRCFGHPTAAIASDAARCSGSRL